MVVCPKCGEKLADDAVYCSNCGQKIEGPVTPSPIPRVRVEVDRELRRRGPDYLDGVGFGVFLIAVAYMYLQFPWVFDEIIRWLRTWSRAGPTMLPVILVDPVALFFIIMGGWGIVEGALRIIAGRIKKGVGNIVGGIFGLSIAYVLYLYQDGSIQSSAILPILIILLGASIAVSALAEIPRWK